MYRLTQVRTIAVFTLILALAGCGTKDKNVVSGVIKLDGQPCPGAEVRFVPKGNPDLGTATATTDANGNYIIQPDAHNNNLLRPGTFVVLVSKVVSSDPQGGMGTPTRDLIPARYTHQSETPLTVDLKAGTNELPPFELTSKK